MPPFLEKVKHLTKQYFMLYQIMNIVKRRTTETFIYFQIKPDFYKFAIISRRSSIMGSSGCFEIGLSKLV